MRRRRETRCRARPRWLGRCAQVASKRAWPGRRALEGERQHPSWIGLALGWVNLELILQTHASVDDCGHPLYAALTFHGALTVGWISPRASPSSAASVDDFGHPPYATLTSHGAFTVGWISPELIHQAPHRWMTAVIHPTQGGGRCGCSRPGRLRIGWSETKKPRAGRGFEGGAGLTSCPASSALRRAVRGGGSCRRWWLAGRRGTPRPWASCSR